MTFHVCKKTRSLLIKPETEEEKAELEKLRKRLNSRRFGYAGWKTKGELGVLDIAVEKEDGD